MNYAHESVEVIEEAVIIRNALEILGWMYVGGGPYPKSPKMKFTRGDEVLVVSLSRDR